MGFVVDGCAILFGGIIGGSIKKSVDFKNNAALSIAIMLISAVGLFENILGISDGKIVGEHTVTVSIAIVLGCLIGDALKLEDRIYSFSITKNESVNGVIDSILFFGIGGLQISGPILYALENDSFQLILKGVIDFPFALMLGAVYGKKVSLSALAVVLGQIAIAALAYAANDLISANLVRQLCSIGYLILFFSGYNMLCKPQNKIKNINIIPGVFLIIAYNLITEAFSR